MVDVYLTSDVEIWCNGWNNLDDAFPAAFKRYIYGHTKHGDYGLGFQTQALKERGLTANFFVEPLFSYRFGLPFLSEIVDIIQAQQQNVELHLHTEWVDEITPALIPNSNKKRQHLRYFTLEEQTQLIAAGKQQLLNAGVDQIDAFRAGSFAFNQDTLTALTTNGIGIDSSYNATQFGPSSGVRPEQLMTQAFQEGAISEYPMSVFDDGFGKLRHAQLTACSFREIETILWQALESGQQSFVFLFHNFELLNRSHNHLDRVMLKRFEQLLDFLERNRKDFPTQSFSHTTKTVTEEPDTAEISTTDSKSSLNSAFWQTALRYAEQLYRRKYNKTRAWSKQRRERAERQ